MIGSLKRRRGRPGEIYAKGFPLQAARLWWLLLQLGNKSRPFSLAVFSQCVCVCVIPSPSATWESETKRGKSVLMTGELCVQEDDQRLCYNLPRSMFSDMLC